MKVIDMDSARGIAFRYLGYSARSQSQMAKRLERDEFPPEIIEAILAELTAEGYLDDEAFAAAWVTDRADRKKYGKTRLAQELQRRGVAKETVQEALADVGEEDEIARALGAARPKWKAERYAALDSAGRQAEQRKLSGFLQRRGFGWAIIKQVLAELVANG